MPDSFHKSSVFKAFHFDAHAVESFQQIFFSTVRETALSIEFRELRSMFRSNSTKAATREPTRSSSIKPARTAISDASVPTAAVSQNRNAEARLAIIRVAIRKFLAHSRFLENGFSRQTKTLSRPWLSKSRPEAPAVLQNFLCCEKLHSVQLSSQERRIDAAKPEILWLQIVVVRNPKVIHYSFPGRRVFALLTKVLPVIPLHESC